MGTVKSSLWCARVQHAAAIRRTFGFGANEAIDLPSEAIRRVVITGPRWLQALSASENAILTWIPTSPLPAVFTTAEITLIGDDERVLSSHEGSVRHAGAGSLGYSFDVDVHRRTGLHFLIPDDNHEIGSLNTTFDFTRTLPSLVLQSIRLFRDLHQCSASRTARCARRSRPGSARHRPRRG